jgi:ADP-ribosylglycohydrolase
MTIAVAIAMINSKSNDEITPNLIKTVKHFGRKYPYAGYGSAFMGWLMDNDSNPYNSWGNGSAMRCSIAGWLYDDYNLTLERAKQTAEITHNHPEGIKGAQAIAAGVFMLRTGSTKEEVKEYIEKTFEYDLSRKLDDIRPEYTFHVSCQKSVPEAIIAFLESTSFEDAIRNAVSIGGDSDTIACMAGALAEAYYPIPREILDSALENIKSIGTFTDRDFGFYNSLVISRKGNNRINETFEL